jgi:hypothetical protein
LAIWVSFLSEAAFDGGADANKIAKTPEDGTRLGSGLQISVFAGTGPCFQVERVFRRKLKSVDPTPILAMLWLRPNQTLGKDEVL